MAPGFVYACCRHGKLNCVKVSCCDDINSIQSTAAFQILVIRPFSNPPLAQAIVSHIFANLKVSDNVFDFSVQDAMLRLDAALNHATIIDALPQLPGPQQTGSKQERYNLKIQQEETARKQHESELVSWLDSELEYTGVECHFVERTELYSKYQQDTPGHLGKIFFYQKLIDFLGKDNFRPNKRGFAKWTFKEDLDPFWNQLPF